jgi:hypothetical protein
VPAELAFLGEEGGGVEAEVGVAVFVLEDLVNDLAGGVLADGGALGARADGF